MSAYLNNATEWSDDNLMNINFAKITEMLLGRIIKEPPLNIFVRSNVIERVSSFRLLGVHFDNIVSLQQCIEAIHRWCASRRLQLNPSKTEVIWLGTKASLKKIESMDLILHVDDHVISPVSFVRDLGVLFDSQLSMKQHIGKVASVCFYHLRRLKSVRRILGQQTIASLVSALVLSRLDYCNSMLAGLPKSTIVPLQRVQNSAARLIYGLKSRDHVKPAFRELHWLPVEQRIFYKLCLIMHLIHT